jgi:amino acid efflux transporter
VGTKRPSIRDILQRMLSTRSGTALYVGAVLGPGVLLIPALAAEAAGPASVLAWVGLLALSAPLAITFAALGVRHPEAGGTAAYARAAFGPRAGAVTGWWFLAGVVIGAPAVALIGGFYVAELLGAGREAAVGAAAAMILAVTLSNALGLRATARVQLGLAGLLAALLLVAVVTALPESRADHWTPFAPHGWTAIGTAASLLMLSFIGWEAVSHLAGELADPARQLPRAIFAALAIVVVLYLGLAAATVGVLGTAAPSDVPLADLMAAGLGEPGRTVTAVLAVLLTTGTMNAYVAAAIRLAGALADEGSAPRPLARPAVALALFVAVGAAVLAPLGADLLGLEALVRATNAAFIAVYVIATAAGFRLLAGVPRWAAGSACAAVVVVLLFSGPFLVVPVAVAVAALVARTRSGNRPHDTLPVRPDRDLERLDHAAAQHHLAGDALERDNGLIAAPDGDRRVALRGDRRRQPSQQVGVVRDDDGEAGSGHARTIANVCSDVTRA